MHLKLRIIKKTETNNKFIENIYRKIYKKINHKNKNKNIQNQQQKH